MSDSKEIAVQADPFVEMVERLATNEQIDPDKLEKLVQVQMTILDRNAEAEFNNAMAAVQEELPVVLNDAYNPQTSSTYAKLETINRAIKPIVARHGFSTTFTQGKADTEGDMRVCGTLRHRGGHSVNGYWVELPVDDKGIAGKKNKTGLHGAGSTFTYGRRYLLCMMFDISTGDDTDGVVQYVEPEVRLITDKQAGQIIDMIADLEEDVEQFCKWAKIESVETMPAHKFSRCLKKLEEKRDARVSSTNGE